MHIISEKHNLKFIKGVCFDLAVTLEFFLLLLLHKVTEMAILGSKRQLSIIKEPHYLDHTMLIQHCV